MTNFLQMFSRNRVNIKPIKKNIAELTPNERAEIEDQTANGIPAREIADSLALDVETIYNYRRIITKEKKDQPSDAIKSVLTSKIQEKEILKQDFEIEKLKLDLDSKRQEMEMAREEFKFDMMQRKAELGMEDSNDDMKGLLQLLMNNGIVQAPNTQTPRSVATDVKVVESPNADISVVADVQQVDLDDEKIRAIIKSQTKQTIALAKMMPDSIIFDKLACDYPSLSDKSINRGIAILRSEF